MKKLSKKLISVLLLVIFTAAFAVGCGKKDTSAANTQKKKIKIGCSVYYMSEFVTLMKEGIEKQAKEEGAELIFLDANRDVNKQISQVENLIAQKVDVLLVAAVDSDGIVPAVQMAKNANIPLVGLNMLINTKEPYLYAGPNDVEAGELEMQYAIDKIGGKGNIAILEGPIGTSAQMQRHEGNHNVLKKYPDIKVVAEQPANWSREDALRLTENWIQAFNGKIDAVVAHNDEMALGAIQALEAKGLKSKIPVTGVDAIKDACMRIGEGKMDATVFQDADAEGRLGVKIAAQAARGEKIEKNTNLIKMELIKKDNVDKLLNGIYKK